MLFSFAKDIPSDSSIALLALHEGSDTWLEIVDGRKVLRFGLGARKNVTRRKLPTLLRKIVVVAKNNKLRKLALQFSELTFPHLRLDNNELAQLLATNFDIANFEFVIYKTPPKNGWNFVEEVILVGKFSETFKKILAEGQIIAEEVNRCRSLANTPGGEMTPSVLAEEAKKAIKGTAARAKILSVKEMQSLKMGGILGVAQGSGQSPRFIILEYFGGKKNDKAIVLVGKGVTFDTGGLNIKPSESIYEMHMDMSGGAAVIHAVALAARLKLKKNVVGLVPAVENMTSGLSYRPGDILKSMSGKTIEVLNTDAEGRIILADALTYAARYNPKLVVDVATLTGSSQVALGNRAGALFTRDERLEKLFRDLGEQTGDYVWPLPMWEEYEDEVKGTFGDWANIGKSKYGGAIHGAVFLYQWAKDYPWVHIDMAPRMTAEDGDYLSKGATGYPVRLLHRLLQTYK